MAGPGAERAAMAVGRAHLRASDADREQMIDVLKAAFVQGRLTKDELDARVARTLTSRTYAELAAVTIGIPAALPPFSISAGRTPSASISTASRV